MTGIDRRDLARAPTQEVVSRRLRAEVSDVLSSSPDGVALGVAHFARFEGAFLDAWRTQAEWGSEWLELLCTHEITCRLLPGLPRRGLRAVAGHLGHVMAEEKRAAGHVRATVAVWCALVEKLGEIGVVRLEDLRHWLREEQPSRRGGHDFTLPREKRLELPDAPGVYRLEGRGGEVLYVGKATSLRDRVNSYFQNRHRRPGGDRTLEMLTQVWGVEVTPCGSALEAALREADQIKEHAPPYNVALRGREEAVFFASPELQSVRAGSDDRHPVGPLPRRDSLAALAAQRRLLQAATEPPGGAQLWMEALGMGAPVPGEEGRLDRERVAAEELREGFALYRERTGWTDRTPASWLAMLRVGGRLWREHLAQGRQRSSDEQAGGDGFFTTEEPSRDPAEVARWFALALGRCAQLVRRALWLQRLCESSLWWRPRDRAPQRLLISGGALASCSAAEEGAPGARALPPRGAARTALQRRRSFDAATYDRLRVLTTELRRLVAAGVPVELHLGVDPPLDRATLARRLGGV